MSGLLRNCSLDDLTGLAIDQYETKILCTLTQAAEDTSPMLSVVGVSARITIDEPIFQGAVDQDSEFASSGCHRLRFADAEGEPTVEGAEGGSAAAEVHGRQSRDVR